MGQASSQGRRKQIVVYGEPIPKGGWLPQKPKLQHWFVVIHDHPRETVAAFELEKSSPRNISLKVLRETGDSAEYRAWASRWGDKTRGHKGEFWTTKSFQELEQIGHSIIKHEMKSYNVFTRNCQHFVDKFRERVQNRELDGDAAFADRAWNTPIGGRIQ